MTTGVSFSVDDVPLQRNPRQLADSIAQLTMELKELKDRKKAFLADINPRIKELESLIEMENDQWKRLKEQEGL